MDRNQYIKLCDCGCEQPVKLYPHTNSKHGIFKGQPAKILHGHAAGKYENDRSIAAENARECRRKYKARQIREGKEFVKQHLSSHPCVDCGESDIVVLDLHHINPDDKRGSISDLTTKQHVGVKTLAAEIEKCEVLCANCHRRRHAKEYASGWRN